MLWLQQQQVATPEQFLAEQGGAPLAALASAQSDTEADQLDFLRFLQQPELDGVLKIAEKLQKSAIPLLISWVQRWLYDIFSYKLAGEIRYYPRNHKEISKIAAEIPLDALLALIDANIQRRRVADHPLAAKLLIEEMLLDYARKVKPA